MKVKYKAILKQLMVSVMVICLLGTLAPTAFASCASDENTCTTIAANNYNNCLTNAGNTLEAADISCLLLILPPLILACEATAQIAATVMVNNCNNTYDTDIANCQAIYLNCIGG